jgi:hypothetical protein
MAFEPHIRISALGTRPGNEIFSWGISMARGGGGGFAGPFLDPNNTVWNDLRDDVAAYWATTPCSARAVLRKVKFANIAADGTYASSPIEKPVGGAAGTPGPVVESGAFRPNQVALAITLHTTADLGRVKGRFYLPLPGNALDVDGLISAPQAEAQEAAAVTFVNNMANQPGADVLDLQVVVASQGRRNRDGTVRIGPANHPVTAVSCGRVLDTQRRRRSKLLELRGTPGTVTQS